jgi:hypothetical protein
MNDAQPSPASEATKPCRGCGQVLPLSDYPLKEGRPHSRCRPCKREAGRRWYQTKGKARYEADPEVFRRRAERAAKRAKREARQLAELLARFDDDGSEAAYEAWAANGHRLRELWVASGPKSCATCRRTLPAARFHPPIPASTYPGRCMECANKEYREASLRAFDIYREDRRHPDGTPAGLAWPFDTRPHPFPFGTPEWVLEWCREGVR